MSGRLVALDGTPDNALDTALIVVGRHPSCDVSLDSVRISRVHCCLFKDGENLYVRDLNSTNGVRVNGQVVTLGLIGDQEILSIAHLRYRRDSQASHVLIRTITSHQNDSLMASDKGLESEFKPDLRQIQPDPRSFSSGMEKAIREAIAPVAGLDRYHVEVNIKWQNPEEDPERQSAKAAI